MEVKRADTTALWVAHRVVLQIISPQTYAKHFTTGSPPLASTQSYDRAVPPVTLVLLRDGMPAPGAGLTERFDTADLREARVLLEELS